MPYFSINSSFVKHFKASYSFTLSFHVGFLLLSSSEKTAGCTCNSVTPFLILEKMILSKLHFCSTLSP